MSADFRGRTWTPAFEISDGSTRIECDFGALLRESFMGAGRLKVLFGEAKAGQKRFARKDVKLASAMATLVPGAAFVFATSRASLDPVETKMLSQFAARGRVSIGAATWRCPVIVLTRHELEASSGPPYCWKGFPGFTSDMDRAVWGFPSGRLGWLADVTQRLHLKMPSYFDWLNERQRKRQIRVAKKAH